jgi:hypothetical protein
MTGAIAALVLALAAEPATPAESPVAVTTRVTPDPSSIGDLLELEVVAAYPRGITVNLPNTLTLAPLRLVDVDESPPEVTGQGLRTTFKIRLQHFAVGAASVPGFPLTYVTEDGAVETVQVPPHPFTVESLLANEPEPQRRGEDPPVSIVYPDERTEIIVWSALGTLVAAALAWWALRRLRRRARPAFVPPPIPAHVLALEALDELERGELLAEGRFQDYYLQLTEVAKAYVERRFGVLALDRTTDEIRRELVREGDRIAPLSADDLVAFLQRCDLVKFARFAPETDEAQHELGRVRDMVETTRPDKAAPPPAEPGPHKEVA